MGFCTRHEHGERTSLSVWCNHARAPACDIKSAYVADGQRCWNPPGGKNAKSRASGYLCPLTTGGLIRVLGCRRRAGCLYRPGLGYSVRLSCEPLRITPTQRLYGQVRRKTEFPPYTCDHWIHDEHYLKVGPSVVDDRTRSSEALTYHGNPFMAPTHLVESPITRSLGT